MHAITEGLIDSDAIMSNAVYLKNFGNTVIKNANMKGPNVDPNVLSKNLNDLLAIIKIFV